MRYHNMQSLFALVCRTHNYPICIYIIHYLRQNDKGKYLKKLQLCDYLVIIS
jgi:hypothetical protein